MKRLRITRKDFKFTTLDGMQYMIPDFTGRPQFVFDRLGISLGDDGEDVISTDGEGRALKRSGDIVCYQVNIAEKPEPTDKLREIIVALYREGVNKPTAVERLAGVQMPFYWHLLWDNIKKSMVVPGRHFLLLANMKPATEIADQFERLEDCYIYRFVINEVKNI